MTFDTLAAKPGVGIAYLVSVESTTAGVTTVLARWATASGYYGTAYLSEQRILSMGNVTRAFGSTRSMTAGTVSMVLDNADASLDAMCDRATFGTWRRCTYRVLMALYDPAAPSDVATQTLGLFTLMDNPQRDTATVRISLADKTTSEAAELKRAPSVRDWVNTADASRPAVITAGPGQPTANPNFDWDRPAPVCIGLESMPIQRIAADWYLICAVAQDRAASPSFTVSALWANGNVRAPVAIITSSVRSANITVEGVTWHLIYAQLQPTNQPTWLRFNFPEVADQVPAFGVVTSNFYAFLDGLEFAVQAVPLSATNSLTSYHPADVAKELLTKYSGLVAADVDTASFTAVKNRVPGVTASGTMQTSGTAAIGDWGARTLELSGGDLGKALGDLAILGRFEIVVTSAGVVTAKALMVDFTSITTTPTPIDETLMGDVQERIGSRGERWEPWTDLYVTLRGQRFGPFRSARAFTDIGCQVTKSISCDWVGPATTYGAALPGQSPMDWATARQVAQAFLADPVTVRPLLKFRTSLDAVTLELGDFISASWTRGGRGTPYVSARWRVESWTLQSENGCIDIEAVWCADIDDATRRPYLLDNEALLVRLAGVDDLDLTPGSGVISFTGTVNIIAAGVVAGDILVMRDSLEAATSFLTNRAFRVVSVDAASQATVTPVLDAGAPVTLLGADWTIYRGATTYPTAVSDPTNYPSGGAMYGKVSDSTDAGKYSDNSAANLLLNG